MSLFSNDENNCIDCYKLKFFYEMQEKYKEYFFTIVENEQIIYLKNQIEQLKKLTLDLTFENQELKKELYQKKALSNDNL